MGYLIDVQLLELVLSVSLIVFILLGVAMWPAHLEAAWVALLSLSPLLFVMRQEIYLDEQRLTGLLGVNAVQFSESVLLFLSIISFVIACVLALIWMWQKAMYRISKPHVTF